MVDRALGKACNQGMHYRKAPGNEARGAIVRKTGGQAVGSCKSYKPPDSLGPGNAN